MVPPKFDVCLELHRLRKQVLNASLTVWSDKL